MLDQGKENTIESLRLQCVQLRSDSPFSLFLRSGTSGKLSSGCPQLLNLQVDGYQHRHQREETEQRTQNTPKVIAKASPSLMIIAKSIIELAEICSCDS